MNGITTFILKTYAMELIICYTINIFGNITMAYSQSYFACSLSIQPLRNIIFFAGNTSMFLSVSRCFVKRRAEESKFVNPDNVVACIKCFKIICYIVLGIMCFTPIWFNSESEIVDECANTPFYKLNEQTMRKYASMFTLLFTFFQFLASIVSELTLKRIFDARRKNRNQSTLTIWSDVGTNLDSDKIPIKSTFISVFYLLFIYVIVHSKIAFASHFHKLMSKMTYHLAYVFFGSIVLICHMPIIFKFMFNYKKFEAKKLLEKHPPTGIQFHNIMEEIPDDADESKEDEEGPVACSSNLECTVNPSAQSAVFTIKVRPSKHKYELNSESLGRNVIFHHNQYDSCSTLPPVE